MKNKILFAAMLFFVANIVYSQKKNLDLYLLIGQSNMAGRGTVEAQDTTAYPRVLTLDENNKWVPAKDPIHFDKTVAGVGLGRTFGIKMAKANPEKTIGLIPCAVGGSSIDAWMPGGFHEQTQSHPWDDMEKRLKIALQSGEVKGILWHQGESDSNPESCAEYKDKLKDLIFRVRELAGNEHIPFVAGEFGRFKIKENKKQYPNQSLSPAEIVMKSTIDLMKEDKNAAFVSSWGLDHKGDNTHFDSKSYRTLGKRYAKKMIKLQRK